MGRARPYFKKTGVLIRIGNLDTLRNPGMHAHTEREDHMRTQCKGSHLQAKEGGLQRNQLC